MEPTRGVGFTRPEVATLELTLLSAAVLKVLISSVDGLDGLFDGLDEQTDAVRQALCKLSYDMEDLVEAVLAQRGLLVDIKENDGPAVDKLCCHSDVDYDRIPEQPGRLIRQEYSSEVLLETLAKKFDDRLEYLLGEDDVEEGCPTIELDLKALGMKIEKPE